MRSGGAHKLLDMEDKEGKSMEACREEFVFSASVLCDAVFAV
jgi:hypothetical protein